MCKYIAVICCHQAAAYWRRWAEREGSRERLGALIREMEALGDRMAAEILAVGSRQSAAARGQ